MLLPNTVDFETKKIESRPNYPPRPVGAAIRWHTGKNEYLAWGHPSGNNCTIETARRVLFDIWNGPRSVLFHNCAFDLDVAEIRLNLRLPSRFDDTLYLAFLNNPHELDCGLKPMAEKYLGMRPDERDRLKDWILANVPEAKRKKSEWGAYISEAPVSLVAPYAIGDVERTFWLYMFFIDKIKQGNMEKPYHRELALTRTTLEMERSGIRGNVEKLKRDIPIFQKLDANLCEFIRKRLSMPKGSNVNSSAQLAKALETNDKLHTVFRTPKGQVSTSIAHLRAGCSDKKLVDALAVHSVIEKNVSTFMTPWLFQMERTGGRILPGFNQVRDRGEAGGRGARSGRYSSSEPNLQQVSAGVDDSKNKDVLLLAQKLLLNLDCEFIGMRDYLIPDEGMFLMCADYNQQEVRLLADFEQGSLLRAYLDNPNVDIHTYCMHEVQKITGILFPRKFIKIVVFGIIYGMGLDLLAAKLESDKDTAKKVKAGLLKAIPGISKLMDKLKELARHGEPLITWGGRKYYCEEPKFVEKFNKWMTFEYKMLNYLIQPSAADVTKQGMLNVRDIPNVRIAAQVHDELMCMAPERRHGKLITDAMCDMKFKVPMLAEVKMSRESWARVK